MILVEIKILKNFYQNFEDWEFQARKFSFLFQTSLRTFNV